MGRQIIIPKDAAFIINKLEENGYEAYVVGGCVRDSLLGIEPHDWDICTSALPEQVLEVFSDYKVILTGLQHGTVTIVIDTEPYEVTTYRIDGEYKDNRHPEKVEFVSNLELDLMRRDFTINSMAYNDKNGLVDLFGGIDDIENKVIRCVGNPDDRFTEDALRMIRAIRFAIKYGCEIEENTLISLLTRKELIKNISVERINSELQKILDCEVEIKSYDLMRNLVELLKPIIPDMHIIDVDIMCERMARSIPNFYIRLATLFDISSIEEILKKLKFSNEVIDNTVNVRKYGYKIFNERPVYMSQFKYFARRLLHDVSFDEAVNAVQFARLLGKENDIVIQCHYLSTFYAFVLESYYKKDVYTLSGLAINGNDLLILGYKGKQIGKILNTLLDMVMQDETLNTKEKLFSCVKTLRLE